MKIYKRVGDGTAFHEGGRSISASPDNMDYVRMLEEVAAGTSEVRDEDGDIVVID